MRAIFLFCMMIGTLGAGEVKVEKFNFENHDYLIFECKTVLHDPNCKKCHFDRFCEFDSLVTIDWSDYNEY
jgi:hypothetical protein